MINCLRLKKSNCKNCYKCIRHCPVKSIRFSGNQAHIIGDECILCGHCFVVCPQNAKEIVDDTEKVRVMIQSGALVYVSLAHSFIANYEGVGIEAMRDALLQLGFADVEETAVGATIVKREYDRILAEGSYATIRDYGTVSQGILYCARGFSLRNAEITVKMGEHYPAHAEGSIGLYMETAGEGVRRLDISFEADATDIGDTMLKKFDPADYGVELAPDAVDYGREEPYQPVLDAALKDQMELDAMDIWRPAGFNTNATAPVSCEWDEYNYIVTIRDGDGIDKKTFFDETGRFYHMEASPNDWWDGILSIEEYNTEPQLDSETDRKAKAFFMEYLENIHYEQRDQVKDLRVQWTFEKNGNLYVCYEDEADPNGEGVYFVIRISPEMRIESYSCISNG